ncbi:MAG: hypothetical protein ACI9HK_003697 [Pirellulaceae bacterium]|jgi:hypothetical protein
MNVPEFSSALPTNDQRVSNRVYGLECTIELYPTLENCTKITGTIKDESETGIGILVDDAHNVFGGMQLLISDFDRERLGEVRHLSRVGDRILLGIYWLA